MNHKNPKLSMQLSVYASQLLKNNSNPITKDLLEINEDQSVISSDNEDSENDEEGISCIPIFTVDGKHLWLDKDKKIVYEPEGEDGGEEIGFLKPISEKYHKIFYEDNYFTIIKKINVKKRGDILCCVLSNKLFDKKMNYIGNRNHIKNQEYQFEFFDEI